MMSVFNHVLEEVESLNRKYAPVSYLASNSFKCIFCRQRFQKLGNSIYLLWSRT